MCPVCLEMFARRALSTTSYRLKNCYLQIAAPQTAYKTMDVQTTSIEMEGVSRNRIRQCNETRYGRLTQIQSTILSNFPLQTLKKIAH